jgi:hypothetical protein
MEAGGITLTFYIRGLQHRLYWKGILVVQGITLIHDSSSRLLYVGWE